MAATPYLIAWLCLLVCCQHLVVQAQDITLVEQCKRTGYVFLPGVQQRSWRALMECDPKREPWYGLVAHYLGSGAGIYRPLLLCETATASAGLVTAASHTQYVSHAVYTCGDQLNWVQACMLIKTFARG